MKVSSAVAWPAGGLCVGIVVVLRELALGASDRRSTPGRMFVWPHVLHLRTWGRSSVPRAVSIFATHNLILQSR
jgi:hypothetical protein